MSCESVLTMAKKKTAGPESPMTTPGTTRRRGVKKIDTSGAEAAPGPAVAIDSGSAETVGNIGTGRPIEAADDRSGDIASSGNEPTYGPSYEEIAEAAYQRYLSRGGQHGRDFDDWLDAERDLRSRK